MDSLKEWIIEVGIKKMGPSLVKGAVAALVGIMMAHQGFLDALGISYDKPGNTIDINLTTFSVWVVTMMTGGLTALFTAIQHHTQAAITGQPQSGDPAKETRRATDPPTPPQEATK
jgi:hypothetical protein